jgi:hypothetical protein
MAEKFRQFELQNFNIKMGGGGRRKGTGRGPQGIGAAEATRRMDNRSHGDHSRPLTT